MFMVQDYDNDMIKWYYDNNLLLCPAPNRRGGIKRCFWLTSDVCLLRTSGLSREQRGPGRQIGTGVAHFTRDLNTTFKVKRSKVKVTRPLYSSRRLRIRQLQRWAWERIYRENLLLRCGQARSARRRADLRRPQREERGGGILWRLPNSLFFYEEKPVCVENKGLGTYNAVSQKKN